MPEKTINTFDLSKLPSQKGKLAVITGANIGLGFETAKALAQKDVEVILACRNLKKAEQARQKIHQSYPPAQVSIMEIDLSSQNSVKQFIANFTTKRERLDLLINNAGIMMPPYQKTEDGFESQMATNYFGHFTLTSGLLDILEHTKGSRVITLSSLAHAMTDINFDDPHFEKNYDPKKGYAQSKLACLMFAYELQRRLDEHDFQLKSLAAHPGISLTNLGKNLPGAIMLLGKIVAPIFFQPPHKACLPILRAALDPEAKGGEYYGPGGFRQYKGEPVRVGSDRNSRNIEKAKKLWELSESLTGISFFELVNH